MALRRTKGERGIWCVDLVGRDGYRSRNHKQKPSSREVETCHFLRMLQRGCVPGSQRGRAARPRTPVRIRLAPLPYKNFELAGRMARYTKKTRHTGLRFDVDKTANTPHTSQDEIQPTQIHCQVCSTCADNTLEGRQISQVSHLCQLADAEADIGENCPQLPNTF